MDPYKSFHGYHQFNSASEVAHPSAFPEVATPEPEGLQMVQPTHTSPTGHNYYHGDSKPNAGPYTSPQAIPQRRNPNKRTLIVSITAAIIALIIGIGVGVGVGLSVGKSNNRSNGFSITNTVDLTSDAKHRFRLTLIFLLPYACYLYTSYQSALKRRLLHAYCHQTTCHTRFEDNCRPLVPYMREQCAEWDVCRQTPPNDAVNRLDVLGEVLIAGHAKVPLAVGLVLFVVLWWRRDVRNLYVRMPGA